MKLTLIALLTVWINVIPDIRNKTEHDLKSVANVYVHVCSYNQDGEAKYDYVRSINTLWVRYTNPKTRAHTYYSCSTARRKIKGVWRNVITGYRQI